MWEGRVGVGVVVDVDGGGITTYIVVFIVFVF